MKTDEQKLNIVGAAAQLLLENGSETYRVEETAQRMAKGFGMEQVNIAAFPTSVFLEADGRAYVRRISRRGTNSRRIAMVNEISREVEHGKLSAEQAERALERARSTPGFSQRVLIPAYALAAASFCLLFGGDAATFGVTFAIGVIVQAVQPWFAHIQMGVLLGNFVGGWLTAVLAQMLQIALPVYNVNAAIIGGIMPLLSGLAMTTAVRDTVYGDLVSGMARALEAMLLATAVAIGLSILANVVLVLRTDAMDAAANAALFILVCVLIAERCWALRRHRSQADELALRLARRDHDRVACVNADRVDVFHIADGDGGVGQGPCKCCSHAFLCGEQCRLVSCL